jgi:imidazolonepropionase-like amidohydrolase
MRAAGVPMVVHSDAGPGPTRFDDFVASVRVFAAGMETSAVEAIRAATGIPAAALGLERELGTVEVGRLADLILVEGDASTRLPLREQIRRVIQGGKTVSFGEALPGAAP